VADKPSEHGVNYQWYTLYISLGVITDSKLELVFFFCAEIRINDAFRLLECVTWALLLITCTIIIVLDLMRWREVGRRIK
jgi:hypothetical protein